MTAGGTALACVVLGIPSRRRRGTAVLGIVLFGLFVTSVGCGGGSGSSGGTPAGSYSVVVKATSGTITRNLTVSLTVQ
jgi:hypothetical protein